jgi:hypothetical protein
LPEVAKSRFDNVLKIVIPSPNSPNRIGAHRDTLTSATHANVQVLDAIQVFSGTIARMPYFQELAFASIVLKIINHTNKHKNIADRSIQNIHHQSFILNACIR